MPARWVLLLVAVMGVVLTGGRFGKLAVAGLAWSFAPRKLKLVAAGLAAAWTITLMGAIAAIALLAMQAG